LPDRSFLLHGVTGSGKTEVYLRAIAHAVRLGRRAVFLVPEISLTPQTLERVNAWFAGRVALLHSQQTPRQKFDQWWDIRGGNFDVAVGPRSALFAPVDKLGIIVIDEEHEWTYKQEESAPLYHARSAALELARRTGAVVVLGSATPSVESYYHASRGRLRLLELPRRVAGSSATNHSGEGSSPSGEITRHSRESGNAESSPRLAQVQVCDMRQELREGNRHIFSRALSAGLRECLGNGNQAILFLNRRGSSSIVQCRDCGYVAVCRRCATPLTCHAAPARLLCHQCNYSRRPLTQCPECRGSRIRQLGLGTERVVAEVSGLFPGVRVARLDSDVLRQAQGRRGGAEASGEAVARLASGETQVLVGTQMVAKGLDIPNVALVGVVLADIGLHVPDFRAGERAFSLLCQVAGRAGRGDAPGRVFIQTYDPEHYAIRAGANQDYSEMYRREIESRRRLGYPPFNQLAHIVCQNADGDACQRQATAIADELKRRAAAEGRTDIEVNGPAPGLPPRLRGRRRWRLLLRGRGLAEFLDAVDFPAGCTVNIDPAHVT
jgi:primosomal protein N' (replication factor Y)